MNNLNLPSTCIVRSYAGGSFSIKDHSKNLFIEVENASIFDKNNNGVCVFSMEYSDCTPSGNIVCTFEAETSLSMNDFLNDLCITESGYIGCMKMIRIYAKQK